MSLTNISIGMHALNNSFNSEATAHSGINTRLLMEYAANGGSSVVRVPVDLSTVTTDGFPAWQIALFEEVISAAEDFGLKVIFEPGQTPADLAQGGDIENAPEVFNIEATAVRFATGVQQVHQIFSGRTDVIEGWEVGNEPNLSYAYVPGYVNVDFVNDRFYSVSVENGQYYAQYLEAVTRNVAAAENNLGTDIKIIGAGIAHNDYDFTNAYFSTLQSLGVTNIDGFAVHPYTTYNVNYTDPASGRPSDWVPNPNNGDSESWDYYFSWQGALYNFQSLANVHGFGASDIYVTEFGVPSYLGYRNSGPDGENDQARWYAEALGVFDSWGNANLQAVVAHDVLDNLFAQQNAYYNAYDGNPATDGTGALAEGSFGLYGRDAATGVIYEKAALQLIRAIANGDSYNANRVYVTQNNDPNSQNDFLNFSTYGSNGFGLASGYFVLTRDGSDQIVGSGFDDSIFSGSGNDIVEGGGGADRIYGGSGNDTLHGNAGNDDIYGNTGDDLIYAGSGANRVDGGTGYDRIILTGIEANYTITGNGQYLSVIGNGESIEGINLEAVQFSDSNSFQLSNIDVNRGNGGVSEGGITDPDPGTSNTIYGTEGDDYITNGTSGNDLIIADSGADVILATAGNDTIVGGDEYNQMDYLGAGASSSNFTFTDNGDGSVTAVSAQFGQDLLWGIGGAWFGDEGEWYSMDTLIAASPPPNPDPTPQPDTTNTIYGSEGDDYITNGTSGNDLIIADSGADVILATAGDDTIVGGAEYNQMDYLGTGASSSNFTFTDNGNGSVTAVSAQFGQDLLWGIGGAWFGDEGEWYSMDTLIAASPPPNPDPTPQPDTTNTIYGSEGDDYITNGTSGNDLIIADSGADVILATAGNDTIVGGDEYNQMDYLGTGASSSNFTFTDNGNGSVTVVSAQFGQDLLWGIGGAWFGDEGEWYSMDTLIA